MKMTSEIIVAIVAFIGTLIGTFGGIVTSAKLTNYRIQQLENKVQEHNNFARRIPLVEQRMETVEHRVETIERKVEQ